MNRTHYVCALCWGSTLTWGAPGVKIAGCRLVYALMEGCSHRGLRGLKPRWSTLRSASQSGELTGVLLHTFFSKLTCDHTCSLCHAFWIAVSRLFVWRCRRSSNSRWSENSSPRRQSCLFTTGIHRYCWFHFLWQTWKFPKYKSWWEPLEYNIRPLFLRMFLRWSNIFLTLGVRLHLTHGFPQNSISIWLSENETQRPFSESL